jgi:hypothetical protein
LVCLLLAGTGVANADSPFMLQPLRVLLGGDFGTLEALFVRPSAPGRAAIRSRCSPMARRAMPPNGRP